MFCAACDDAQFVWVRIGGIVDHAHCSIADGLAGVWAYGRGIYSGRNTKALREWYDTMTFMKASVREASVPSAKWMMIVFLIALFLRIYHLGELPKSFYVEELTNTYVGKFIFLHGKDINGHPWPLLYFDKFGDYPPVLPLYLSGASALIFGTNEFAARFPIALFGALLVIAVYKLSFLIFGNGKVSIFTSFITAILPWHVVLSRTTAEGVVGLTLYAFAILWALRAIGEGNTKLLFKSFFLFFLCYFSYPALRILVPLTLLPLPFFTYRTDKKMTQILIALFLLFSLLTGYITTTKWGRARFDQTSLFKSSEIKKSIEVRNKQLSDSLGQNHVLRARIFHNKATGYVREFLNQYLSYFSPRYLFFDGGFGQYRYYNVPDQGLLFVALLPFFLFAFTSVIGMKRNLFTYVLYLLVIAPLPSALTVDFTPHAHRSLFMILPLVLIAGSGFYALVSGGILKKGVIGISLGFLAIEFIYFWNQYEQSNAFQSMLRNDGDKEIAVYMRNERTKYAQVFAPIYERLPFYYLFYSQNFSSTLMGKFKEELRIDHIDNISFVGAWCPSTIPLVQQSPKNILIIERADCDKPSGYQVLQTIRRMDGTTAYNILRARP